MALDDIAGDDDASGQLLFELLMRVSTAEDFRSDARFTYLIGDNGAGKSRILAEVAMCIAKTKPQRSTRVACISNSLYDRFSRKYDSPYVQYLGARNPDNAVFHANLDRSLCRMLLAVLHQDVRLLRSLERALEMTFHVNVPAVVDRSGKLAVEGILSRRKLRFSSVEEALTPTENRTLASMMGGQFSFQELNPRQAGALMKLVQYNGDPIVGVRQGGGPWVRFKDLSSGEQSHAMLFAKVLSVAQEGMTILIDEPEVSLHLHWQMKFHRSLTELLKRLKRVHVIIATHAPVVVSEAARSDPNSHSNAVMVLTRMPHSRRSKSGAESGPRLKYRRSSFAEVASHEQLVLRYFDTAPYHTHAVGVEVAEKLLGVTNGQANKDIAISSLNGLLDIKGVTDESKDSILIAIRLLEGHALDEIVAQVEQHEIAVH